MQNDNLETAREILLQEAARFMPEGAATQRQEIIDAIDLLLANDKQQNGLSAYDNLKQAFELASKLGQASEIIGWVQQTHLMQELSLDDLANASSALSIHAYRILSDKKIANWNKEVKTELDRLPPLERRNFELMEKAYLETACLDEELVDQLERAMISSQESWEKNKPLSNFAAWLPEFENIVSLVRKKAKAQAEAFGVGVYEALLDDYNSEMEAKTVERIFADVKNRLPGLIDRVIEHQSGQPEPLPLPDLPVEVVKKISTRIMADLGLDPKFSRVDESVHGFSSGEWDDVRITANFSKGNVLDALMTIIHEVGHALYSGNLPREFKNQPIGDFQSMWVHESQSIFWERQVASSAEFMKYVSKVIKSELGSDAPEWSADNLFNLVRRVERSLIRVEADEVTYPIHVVLRYEIEQKLASGELAAKDVPSEWNRLMKELLHVEVPDDQHGCMQDIHWSDGSIGYFPAYSLGAFGAAQLFEALRKDIPHVGALISEGRFTSIRNWLEDKIHSKGSIYTGEELFKLATGKDLSADSWFRHIENRYLNKSREVETSLLF